MFGCVLSVVSCVGGVEFMCFLGWFFVVVYWVFRRFLGFWGFFGGCWCGVGNVVCWCGFRFFGFCFVVYFLIFLDFGISDVVVEER